jgi:hypothetical protein
LTYFLALAVCLLFVQGEKELDESQLEPPTQAGRQIKCNVLAASATRLSDFNGCSLVRELNRILPPHALKLLKPLAHFVLPTLLIFCFQSTSFSSSLFVNPRWLEVEDLRKWFATKGFTLWSKGQAAQLSTNRSGGEGSNAYLDSLPAACIGDCLRLKAEYTATREPLMQPVLMRIPACITYIKKTAGSPEQEHPPWYLSCQTDTCKGKKVQQADGGGFYCEKVRALGSNACASTSTCSAFAGR